MSLSSRFIPFIYWIESQEKKIKFLNRHLFPNCNPKIQNEYFIMVNSEKNHCTTNLTYFRSIYMLIDYVISKLVSPPSIPRSRNLCRCASGQTEGNDGRLHRAGGPDGVLQETDENLLWREQEETQHRYGSCRGTSSCLPRRTHHW